MSFDAVEKYNTYKRLLIPKETGMFATVAVLSNGRQKDNTKEHVHRDSPLTSCVLFPKIRFRLSTCRVIFSLWQAFEILKTFYL